MSRNKLISLVTFLVVMPIICISGKFIFPDKMISWVMLSTVILVCVIAFAAFERKKITAAEVSIIAVFTALSVVGRLAFAAIPAFKPCTAVIILAGIYLGKEQGFMIGALTALLSNFYFGQGAWTPFQMLAWGIIGYCAGLFAKQLAKSKIFIVVFGGLSGAFFSLVMDLWSALWADNGFNLTRYLALIVSSLQFTVIYMVSNAVFLLLLIKPTSRIFRRLQRKYNIGQEGIL